VVAAEDHGGRRFDPEQQGAPPEQTRSTKVLLKKMKHLSLQRRANPQQSYTKPTIPIGKENKSRVNNGTLPKRIPSIHQTPVIKGSSVKKAQDQRNLQSEYDLRRRTMKAKLSQQVQKNATGPQKVKIEINRGAKNIYAPELDLTPSESQPSSRLIDQDDDLDLIPGRERSLKKPKDANQDKDEKVRFNERLMDYARSKRALQERIQQDQDLDALALQTDGMDLIQELNKRLVELDGINEEKRNLNNDLIAHIRFVRDLQANLGTTDNGNIADVVDKELEAEYRREK